MRIILLIIAASFIVNCVKQEDIEISDGNREFYNKTSPEFRLPEEFIGKPYEYIEVKGYGENWTSTDNNQFKIRLPHYYGPRFKKHFEFGSGECVKYLAELDASKVHNVMKIYNHLIFTEADSKYDVPFKHTTLQCKAYEGVDQNCQNELTMKAKNSVSKADRYSFMLDSLFDCHIRYKIGQKQIYSLED